MARFLVRSDPPGSFDQILGLKEMNDIVEVGEVVEWTPQYGPHAGETLQVDFIPHGDWEPLDDAAEALMKKRGIGIITKPNADGVPEPVMVPVTRMGADGKRVPVLKDGKQEFEPLWRPRFPRRPAGVELPVPVVKPKVIKRLSM